MHLRPIDTPELLQLVAGWLSRKENFQWLDFGDGRRSLTPEWLKLLGQRETDVLRVFTRDDEDDRPVGVVALSSIDRSFKTARIWVVLGDKSLLARGCATRATSAMLAHGFEELGLRAITTWVVEGNPSVRIAERVGFRFVGRQRRCHCMDGQPCDRLWYDMLPSEHRKSP